MMLTLSGLVSGFLIDKIPAFEVVLRIAGALYILWLAWHTLRASYTFDEEQTKPLGFIQGFFIAGAECQGDCLWTDALWHLPGK